MATSNVSLEAVEVIDALGALVGRLDVAILSGEDAAELTALLARGERLCAMGKAMAARRASQCKHFARAGHRSPEQWLAGLSGSSPGAAKSSLAVADQMNAQPALAEACQAGLLSPQQAEEIAAAAAVDPQATTRLIEAASRGELPELRQVCRQVVHAGSSPQDDQARLAALHARRSLRTWLDKDGSGRVHARLTPDGLARFRAWLHPFERYQFEQARRQGEREHAECYAADALLMLAEAAHTGCLQRAVDDPAQLQDTDDPDATNPAEDDAPDGETSQPELPLRVGPPATVIALIDHAVLVRGYARGDECSVIQGLGPVPVTTIRNLMDDAFLRAVVQRGIDIRSVVHLGRSPTAAQWTALWARDRTCVVPGCANHYRLQAHHVTGWKPTGQTRLDDLALLCPFHHHSITNRGWRLSGPPGRWSWRPPPEDEAPGPFDPDGLHLRTPPPGTIHSHPLPVESDCDPPSAERSRVDCTSRV